MNILQYSLVLIFALYYRGCYPGEWKCTTLKLSSADEKYQMTVAFENYQDPEVFDWIPGEAGASVCLPGQLDDKRISIFQGVVIIPGVLEGDEPAGWVQGIFERVLPQAPKELALDVEEVLLHKLEAIPKLRLLRIRSTSTRNGICKFSPVRSHRFVLPWRGC